MVGRKAGRLLDLLREIADCHQLVDNLERAISARADLTPAMRDVLRRLSEGPARTVPALADERGNARQSVQSLVEQLRARGLVEALPNPRSRRSPLIAPTEAGRRALHVAQAREIEVLEALSRDFAANHLATAVCVLADLNASLSEGRARAPDRADGRDPPARPRIGD